MLGAKIKICAADIGVCQLPCLILKIIICLTNPSESLKNEKTLFFFSEYPWGKEKVVLTIAVLRAIQEMENNPRCPWQMRSAVFFFQWTYWFCFKVLPGFDFSLHPLCILSTVQRWRVPKLWINSSVRACAPRSPVCRRHSDGCCKFMNAVFPSFAPQVSIWHLHRAFTV